MTARFTVPRAATLLLIAALSVGNAAAFAPLFSTGNPDGKMAVATRPDQVNRKFEIEAGDDFLAKAGQSVSKVGGFCIFFKKADFWFEYVGCSMHLTEIAEEADAEGITQGP